VPIPVRFTVWSDFLCPWCCVAAYRIDRIAEEYGDAVDVEWKSYLLRPEPQHRSLESFVRYTESWRRPAAEEPGATFTVWASGAAPPSHSVPPAVAAKVAATFGRDAFDAYRRALMHAYFADNRTISDRDVLVDIAAATGLDAGEFTARWRDRAVDLARAVTDGHVEATDRGIYAVPGLLVDDEFVLTGALPLAGYRRVVERRAAIDGGS
jgi:predicted DsbA family dithiol-disulfide isomerase